MSYRNQPRGPDGRWIKGNGGVIAALAALALAVGGFGAEGVAGVGSDGLSAGGGRTPGGDSTVRSRAKARDRSTSQSTARLIRRGLKVRERGVDADTDCAAHSYGQVQTYFRTHPCTALFRALLEVRDGGSNTVLVAVAWVDMPDADQARDLQRLMDRDGTGNVTELSREHGGQRFSGDYYRSAREDTTVVNAQAEPVGRARTALALARQATDAAV